MPSSQGVKIVGLNRFVRHLGQAAQYEPEAVRKELRSFAQIVVDAAIPEMQSQFVSDPSRLDGTLEKSLRTSASVSKRGVSASIKEGAAGYGPPKDNKAPYAGFWEFGGDLKPSGKRRGAQRREFVKKGRVLFPTAKRMQGELLEGVQQVMRNIAAMFTDEGPD